MFIHTVYKNSISYNDLMDHVMLKPGEMAAEHSALPSQE